MEISLETQSERMGISEAETGIGADLTEHLRYPNPRRPANCLLLSFNAPNKDGITVNGVQRIGNQNV
jgi:hypothetical protein